MRAIPAEILARIQTLQKTTFSNANPLMKATIVKAIKTLELSTIRTAARVGGIDIAANTGPTEIWIIAVVSGVAVVNVYTYSAAIDFGTPARTFNLAAEQVGASVRDVAISFDGVSPWLFWVERGVSYDKIFALQWNGQGVQPAATELLSVAR